MSEKAMVKLFELQTARNEGVKKCKESQIYDQRALTGKKKERLSKFKVNKSANEAEFTR